jgi:hypothetical protein
MAAVAAAVAAAADFLASATSAFSDDTLDSSVATRFSSLPL